MRRLAATLVLVVISACSAQTPNPRADVNQDGRIDGGDILEVRAPQNWMKTVPTPTPSPTPAPTPAPTPTPTPGPGYTQFVYVAPGQTKTITTALAVRDNTKVYGGGTIELVGTQPDWMPVLDVAGRNILIEGVTLKGPWEGVVFELDRTNWKRRTFNLTMRNVVVRVTGNGVIGGCEDSVFDNVEVFTNGHCFRFFSFKNVQVLNCKTHTQGRPQSAAIKAHAEVNIGPSTGLVVEGGVFEVGTWGITIGPQYDGVKEVVSDCRVSNATFVATPTATIGCRIAGPNNTVSSSIGTGWGITPSNAALLEVTTWSGIAPTGCRVEHCSIDGGKPVIVKCWGDTVIVP